MPLTPYQIVVPLLSLLAMVYAWNLVLRQKKTIWEAVLWTIFWGVIAGIAFEPSVLSYVSAITGIKDQVNAIIVTSIGILFFLVFYIVIRMEEMNQKQSRLVRMLALREAGLGEKEPKEK
jgi:hypothetical protein